VEVKMNARQLVTCGIDWAERHHDVALIDEHGQLVAKRRISDNAEGFAMLTSYWPTPETTRTTRSR
jgi:hypothetical protein